MKHTLIGTFLFFSFGLTQPFAIVAQTVVYDAGHHAIVNENGAVRLSSEISHNNMLKEINGSIDGIGLNIASVLLVQRLINQSLTQVDQALKSGQSLLHITRLVQDINRHGNEMLEMANGQPWLLLFAEDVARQTRDRGVKLASEVSGFVLKEGQNVLMDYEKRDALLRKIILELKVIRALIFSMQRSMYWAKINGVLKTANPYRGFINTDKHKADEIIRNYGLLKD